MAGAPQSWSLSGLLWMSNDVLSLQPLLDYKMKTAWEVLVVKVLGGVWKEGDPKGWSTSIYQLRPLGAIKELPHMSLNAFPPPWEIQSLEALGIGELMGFTGITKQYKHEWISNNFVFPRILFILFKKNIKQLTSSKNEYLRVLLLFPTPSVWFSCHSLPSVDGIFRREGVNSAAGPISESFASNHLNSKIIFKRVWASLEIDFFFQTQVWLSEPLNRGNKWSHTTN